MLAAALLMAAETGAMYVAGFGVNDLPFLNTRFLIGMSAGCLLWTGCLIVWCQRPRHNRFFMIFVFLYAGVLLSYGVYRILQRLGAEKTNYSFLVSIIETVISAACLILLGNSGTDGEQAQDGRGVTVRSSGAGAALVGR